METNFFVKLDEFEREMTITDHEDVVKLMRYLMNRELELVNTLPKIENHDGKIRAYQKKTEDVEIRKEPRKVLRGPDPMKIGTVELMWTIGLTADGYIAFIALMAIGNVHMLVTEPFAVFRPFIDEETRRVIVVHTHPSEVQITPSTGDLAFTKGLLYAASHLFFKIEDHIILAVHGDFSFEQNDQLQVLKDELRIEMTDKQELQLLHKVEQQELSLRYNEKIFELELKNQQLEQTLKLLQQQLEDLQQNLKKNKQ